MSVVNNGGNRNDKSTAFVFSYHPSETDPLAEGEEAKTPEPVEIFGIIANVRDNTQAASLDLEEWNRLLQGGHIRMALFEPAQRDHTDFRSSVGLDK